MSAHKHPLDKYLRVERLPHIWCPGCGIGIFLNQFARALRGLEAKIDLNRMVIVSGIGCSGRISGYINLDGAHVLHGRAIPFGIGVKLAKPELKVVVIGGDGDIASIGLSHLIHAARKNIDISVIMINNMIYGMTGGQVAPTTPKNAYTRSTPYGNKVAPLNVVKLVAVAGATYVARWSIAQSLQLKKSIENIILHKGFGFLEVISICPEVFGRINGYKRPIEMVRELFRTCRIMPKFDPYNSNMEWGKIIPCGEYYKEVSEE